jgi:hypothetical protein
MQEILEMLEYSEMLALQEMQEILVFVEMLELQEILEIKEMLEVEIQAIEVIPRIILEDLVAVVEIEGLEVEVKVLEVAVEILEELEMLVVPGRMHFVLFGINVLAVGSAHCCVKVVLEEKEEILEMVDQEEVVELQMKEDVALMVLV